MSDVNTAAPGNAKLFEVVIFERGRWVNDWDGELHESRNDGEIALAEARESGWDAHLAELTVIVTPLDVWAAVSGHNPKGQPNG